MKTTRIAAFLLPLTVFLFAFSTLTPKDDDYKVIKVNGAIVIKKTGKMLAQGDVFNQDTPLDFQSPEAKATVINGEKGRFVLTAQAKTAKGNNLIPAINNISSRSGAIINILDLRNQFDGKICVIDELRLKIAGADFKMDDNRFFYLEYTYKGEKIYKKLAHNGDTLIINKAELFKIDGNPIEGADSPAMALYYRNTAENKNLNISNFELVFPNGDDLKGEVKIILDELKTKDDVQKTDEVVSYINEFYGKPTKDNVAWWLRKNFGLKY